MLRAAIPLALPSRSYTRPLTCPRRKLATISRLDPAIQPFTRELARMQPSFDMNHEQITILSEPQHFYQTLINMIGRARNRIFISSLYIGSEEGELISALEKALSSHKSLHLHLTLDLNRSTRPGPASTTSLLTPLLRAFPDRVHVSLFRSPKLKGLMSKLVPPRFNEGWGTWHAKVYGADDEVMISGANLNSSYFTDRQDRYLRFSSPSLAQYCFDFLNTVSGFSYQLLPRDSGDLYVHWPNQDTHPHHFEAKAEHALKELQISYIDSALQSSHSNNLNEEKGVDENDSSCDTLILPVIQAGQFNIHEEERAISLLFASLPHDPKTENRPTIDLTSGYFSLHKAYQKLILDTSQGFRANVNIIASAPKANGFYGSAGISGRIPEAYTLFEQQFMRSVNASGAADVVRLREWERTSWTYHAKGIWLSPSPLSIAAEGSRDPYLTLLGSTNLNARSAALDTELSFILVTSSPELRRSLANEVNRLKEHTREWQGKGRKVRLGTKVAAALVDGML